MSPCVRPPARPSRRPFPLARRILLSTIATPFLLWLALVTLMPTDWARNRLIAELRESTGHHVEIGRLALNILGRVEARDIRVATSGNPSDPWVTVESAVLDLRFWEMIGGCSQPANIEINGMRGRIRRNADGRLEFSELLGREETRSGIQDGSADEIECRGVRLTIHDGLLSLEDETAGSRIEVGNVNGIVTWSSASCIVDDLSGRLNGGTIEFAARCDRTAPQPLFESETRLRGVSLSNGLRGLSYLLPMLTTAEDLVDGRIHMKLALQGRGFQGRSLEESIQGHGAITIDPIDLSTSTFLREVEALCRLPGVDRLGSVHSNFRIGEGRITSDDITIKLAGVPFVLSGWTDFQGRLEYVAHTDLTHEHLSKLPAGIVGELESKLDELAGLRIEGDRNEVRVSIDRGRIATKPSGSDERKRLERIRGSLERILR
ncbi:MAG: AsmA-like C-terminal region-containing protein [Isosphaeraceae bacterium]|nr:AsmA-like C-terminal region-containing protein [Isosphaeraceae bacterium]